MKQMKKMPTNLISKLKKADKAYFNKGKEIMSDDDYDSLRKKAQAQNPDDPYFKTVGAPQVSRDAVRLPVKMPGLDKFNPKELPAYLSQRDDASTGGCLIDAKIDGVSCIARYFLGRLDKVYTRGDDSMGRDITEHARNIKSLPQELAYYSNLNSTECRAENGVFIVRGEFAVPNAVFQKLKDAGKLTLDKGKSKERDYTNPRSMVASLLLRKTPSKLLKHVVFSPFSVEYCPGSVSVLEAKNNLINLFPNPAYGKYFNSVDILHDEDKVNKIIADFRKASPFSCDGIVVTLDGNNTGLRGNKRFAVKPDKSNQANLNSVRTVVKKVALKMSARNFAKPTIHITPVTIDGFTISTVTGNNIREIDEYKIGPGSEVTVIRAGDVIPHIIKASEGKHKITPAKNYVRNAKRECPDCKHTLKWTLTSQGKKGADMYCDDELCLRSKQSVNFFLKLEPKDVGEQNLLTLSSRFNRISDFLKDKNLPVYAELLGNKLGEKTFNAIWDSLCCDMAKVMYASGLFSSGTVSLGEATLRQCLSRIAIPITTDDSKEKKKLKTIISSFNNSETEKLFARRIDAFLEFYRDIARYHEIPETTSEWKGRVYCFTGFRDSTAQKMIIEKGAEYSSGLTKKVTHLVYLDASGKKYEQAKQQNIKLLSLEEFEASL